MHYTGMAAMRGHADIRYDRLLVALSVVIAIGSATAALWLAFRTTKLWQKIGAAIAMGLAIAGMHYTGMRAATFAAHDLAVVPVENGLDRANLALVVAGTMFAVLAGAMIASVVEQLHAEEALRQARAELAHINRARRIGGVAGARDQAADRCCGNQYQRLCELVGRRLP